MAQLKHGTTRRKPTMESLSALSGHKSGHFFGRMFPGSDPLLVSQDDLAVLAAAMADDNPPTPAGDNTKVPAGYTYLGQFIDHDITRDATPAGQDQNEATQTRNFRSPSLDLDSIYGNGPSVSPHLYERDPTTLEITDKLLLGETVLGGLDQTVPAGLPNDLQRNRHGLAIIGDERNDENLLVAQTHLAFLKFHNKVVQDLKDAGHAKEDIFAEAKRIVTWHYQWIVLFDFVERLTEPGLVNKIRHQGRKFYRFKKSSGPYMPVEFSAACYRLGHSMVRQRYSHNRVFDDTGFDLLFHFTGKSGRIAGDLAASAGGVEALPSDWIIDWRRFYEVGGGAPHFNQSRKIDPLLAPELLDLHGNGNREGNLAFLNLRRGVNWGLPSGQDVAKRMKLPMLSEGDLSTGPDGAAAQSVGLHKKTPLWYYILKEAQVVNGGEALGPVGSRIIAEVFLGLVHGDENSFIWQRTDWRPELPAETAGTFTMADLLTYTGDLNPVG